MSSKGAAGIVLSASISEMDLLTYLMSISSSITPGVLVERIKELDNGSNASKVGILSVGAAMNVKKVINDIRSKTGVSLPESWQVDGEVNFSMLAMTGHMIFMLPQSALTTAGQAASVPYVKSIGGVANITMFTQATKLEGKETRAAILLKWAGQMRGFDASKYQSVLAKKFPALVKDTRGIFSRLVSSMFGVVMSPVRAVWSSLKWIFSWLRGIILVVAFVGFSYVAFYLISHTLANEQINMVLSRATFPEDYLQKVPIADAAKEAVAGVIPVMTRFVLSAWSVSSAIFAFAYSGVFEVPALSINAFDFGVATYEEGGKNVMEFYENGGLMSTAKKFAAWTVGAVATGGKEVVKVYAGEFAYDAMFFVNEEEYMDTILAKIGLADNIDVEENKENEGDFTEPEVKSDGGYELDEGDEGKYRYEGEEGTDVLDEF